ncbi:NTP transferase domain-containing protein [Nocardia sp. CNY236]|uniref:NTP transferase domain-containing protein n=1 Tax=Nocardia sp. CNY236 TaxID=1169152 RepID=UPI0018C950D0|nr:NTP transferase domain-containing protein [Nocardia sp. CNY236]
MAVTTVVVLAAGAGRRFGAVYPKELHVLRPGVAVIDPLLDALEALPLPEAKVVVVISAAKLALARHLERSRRDTAFVLLPHSDVETGLGSGLLAAAPWCDDTVLICLGDQVYVSDPVVALSEATTRVGNGDPITVVAASTHDPDRLRHEGALTVTDDVVIAAAEKPIQTDGFNACWSALAIRKPMLAPLAHSLREAVTECLIDAPVVWGPDFLNLNEPADVAEAAKAGYLP